MSKREYIKNITPGTAFVMDGTNGTVYIMERYVPGTPGVLYYSVNGQRNMVVKAGLTTVTLVQTTS